MTVYVDDFKFDAQVGSIRGKWSHLMADSHDELMQFAIKIGLRPSWIQHPHSALEHFDVTLGKRREALKAGAIELTYLESGALVAAKRKSTTFDVELFRSLKNDSSVV